MVTGSAREAAYIIYAIVSLAHTNRSRGYGLPPYNLQAKKLITVLEETDSTW